MNDAVTRPRSDQTGSAGPDPHTGGGGAVDETTVKLQNTLKPSWVFAIALGSAVGWGAFILPLDWLADGGTAGALIGFAIGAVLIGIIAISYGVVIRALPVTGGELAFVLEAFGRKHAYVVGWFLALAYMCIVALNATAVALVFRMLFPTIMEQVHLWSVAGWDIYLPEVLVALVSIVAAGTLNALGTALSGRFQFLACMVMIAAVVVILVTATITYLSDPTPLYRSFPAGGNPLGAIAVMVAFAPWAFVGFDNVPQAAGEFDFHPKKALGLILAAIGTAGAIYLAMIFSTSVAAGRAGSDFQGSVWATAEAITDMMGPFGRVLMALAVLMGIVTGLNGFTVSSSRVVLTMGRASMLPAVFGKVNLRFGTPVVAIVFTTLLCCLAPFFGRSALNWIVDMTSVGVTVAYGYTCLCAFRLAGGPKAKEHVGRYAGIMRAVAGLGAVLALGFLLLLFVPGSPGQLGAQPLIALVVWVVLGAIFYLTRHRALADMPAEELEEVVLKG